MLANAHAQTWLRALLNPQVANLKYSLAGRQGNRRFCSNRFHIMDCDGDP